ncbi:ras-domain-containing protein [Calocera viscosa TUFC12733]|uniref:Ras-domain-containing protein n=1 Tax=Calocera viscosa (strain TUFC12733) TaxID=1330018 RepID=A0A167HXF8_CALVF|nr:ras-domain-containing protein [Calocera viscosa TUFC12733]
MMQTIKVVIIGESGVGKTSLRNQYTTSRFSPSYRGTVGIDFHSLTLTFPPHEACILQVWDTAGQERFAPLSRPFFRGTDAVLLVFDCTQPKSLQALKSRWAEFSGVEGTEGAVVVAVGNKLDLKRVGEGVEEDEARVFIDTLLPELVRHQRGRKRRRQDPVLASPAPISSVLPTPPKFTIPISQPSPSPSPPHEGSPPPHHTPVRRTSSPIPTPSASHSHFLHNRSTSATRHLLPTTGTVGTIGTLTSIATHPTIYHTPSSSLFDRLDGELAGRVNTPTPPATPPKIGAARKRGESSGSQDTQAISFISDSEATIIPFPLAETDEGEVDTPATDIEDPLFEPVVQEVEEIPEPALFFTSSLDRTTVVPVFEYVARKVMVLRDEEEARRSLASEEAAEAAHKRTGWIRLGMPGRQRNCCT